MIIKSKLSFIRNQFSSLEADYTDIPSNKDESYPYPAQFPGFLAQLGLFELEKWSSKREKRKELLVKYIKHAEKLNLAKYLPRAYFNDRLEIIPLRFVYSHPNSQKIKKQMSKFIDINMFWFMQPIIVCEKPEMFNYVYGTCPISEHIGSNIINWPCVFNEAQNFQLLKYFEEVHA